MASTYLTSSYGSTTNRRTWTYSFWIKRAGIGAEQHIWSARNASSTPYIDFRFEAADIINFYEYSGSGYSLWFKTDRVFRDTSGWYHIVIACDTTQATEADRMKIYINGVQETDFSTETYPSQNFDTAVNVSGYLRTVGSLASGLANFNGAMSHFYFIDGLAYAPTVFGSTDATSGEWKINTSPSVTYGDNGFFILKDGNGITDQSGEGNNFTVGGGTLTDLQDCPDDVFCTLNPLDETITGTSATYSNGNNTWTASGNNTSNCGVRGTIGASSGKYYFEAKFTVALYTQVGMSLDNGATPWDSLGDIQTITSFYGIESGGNKRVAGVQTTSVFTALSNNDIGMFAYDLDNNKFWFGVNGTWVASGDPANGTNSLGTLASGTYIPSLSNGSYGTASSNSTNFGNGYFGTTAISSEGTNASGIGKFEYDVPTGYTALSTKGLQE